MVAVTKRTSIVNFPKRTGIFLTPSNQCRVYVWTWIRVSSYTWKTLWVSCSWAPWVICRFWYFGDVLYQISEDSFTVRWRRMVTEIVFNIMTILGEKKHSTNFCDIACCCYRDIDNFTAWCTADILKPRWWLLTTGSWDLKMSLQRTWMIITHCKTMCFISSKFQNLMNTSVSLMMIISVLDGGVKRGRKWLKSLVKKKITIKVCSLEGKRLWRDAIKTAPNVSSHVSSWHPLDGALTTNGARMPGLAHSVGTDDAPVSFLLIWRVHHLSAGGRCNEAPPKFGSQGPECILISFLLPMTGPMVCYLLKQYCPAQPAARLAGGGGEGGHRPCRSLIPHWARAWLGSEGNKLQTLKSFPFSCLLLPKSDTQMLLQL